MKLRLLIVLSLLVLVACNQREQQPSPYAPGGELQSRLDARGKRIVVRDDSGKVLGKLRVRDDEIKVFDAAMSPVGSVSWDDQTTPPTVILAPRGEREVSRLEAPDDGTWILPQRLRLERVSEGWAILTDAGRRLGYVSKLDDGRFALRDDYSSRPRAFARSDEETVRSPAGADIVSATPRGDGRLALPFALEGLDNLTRVALGVWLMHYPSRVAPTASDAGAPDLSD